MPLEELAYIDEHRIDVAATSEDVWEATLRTFGGSTGPASGVWTLGARLLGCEPATRVGWDRPAIGSSVPGFRIVELERPELFVIAGRHRFAVYGIVIRIEKLADGTRCRLESRANFPGLHGRIYRGAVIGSAGHVVGVRRILCKISREAEQPSR